MLGVCFSRWFALALSAGVVSAFAAPPPPASPLVIALSEVRRQGCAGRPGVATPWRQVPALSEAARAVAGGQPLAGATRQAGYRATRIFQASFDGYRDQAALVGAARSAYCRALVDPDLSDIGVHQAGAATWLLLAAPFDPPDAAAAPAVAAEVLRRVNEARARPRRCGDQSFAAAAPLAPDATLDRAAAAHAQDMARQGYLEHRAPDGSGPADRATRAGYRWRAVGENIASGPSSAREVVEGWLASPGHCANLMRPQFTEMGLAYAVNAQSEGGIYWAQTLARPR